MADIEQTSDSQVKLEGVELTTSLQLHEQEPIEFGFEVPQNGLVLYFQVGADTSFKTMVDTIISKRENLLQKEKAEKQDDNIGLKENPVVVIAEILPNQPWNFSDVSKKVKESTKGTPKEHVDNQWTVILLTPQGIVNQTLTFLINGVIGAVPGARNSYRTFNAGDSDLGMKIKSVLDITIKRASDAKANRQALEEFKAKKNREG